MNKKTNLELKYSCESFIPIRKLLKEIGAKKIGVKKQTDYYFNLPKSAGAPKRLKLRIEGSKKTFIYYERLDFSRETSTEAKVVLLDANDNQVVNFLKSALGVRGIVRKVRELWKIKNTVFNLDEIETIGKVFEIELKTTNNAKKDKADFKKLKNMFVPHLKNLLKGSNIDMVS